MNGLLEVNERVMKRPGKWTSMGKQKEWDCGTRLTTELDWLDRRTGKVEETMGPWDSVG